MTVYIGRYTAGDFFRFPSANDIETSLEMCDQLASCPYIKPHNAEISFESFPPFYLYNNWEGQILASDDVHFRLDLQGKPSNLIARDIVWRDARPPEELISKLKHFCQWQLQFGSEGSKRITRTANAAIADYRSKHKGSIAGVMLAMNHRITLDDFKAALRYSFENNSETGRSFGVVISDAIEEPTLPPSLFSSLPKAEFRCSTHDLDSEYCKTKPAKRKFVLIFPSLTVRARYTPKEQVWRSPSSRITISEQYIVRCPACGAALEYIGDLPMSTPRPAPEWTIWVE
ncbi:hypothetical protein NNO07_24865 [Pseudomonas resinovorans]|uniref:Uncharacterized protein n=1 Tax=Metapseudomonas resinovorans TaxID=53412 RepID=A0ABT4YC39_METRE|nr:hypothetical protein [Pseudomonas resinovorans]MDA8486311.1 hypothetical protein [Pseudomonas resinovorans]